MINRTAGLLIVLGLAAALLAASQNADAEMNPNPNTPAPDPAGGDTTSDTGNASLPDVETLMNAFLATIRQFESSGQYDVIFGGHKFASFADHPRVRVWFHDRTRAGSGNNNYSDAAGAYQFLSSTWDGVKRRLSLPDFSPDSQDRAAYQMLVDLHVKDKLAAGDIPGAFAKAAGTWASLPGSRAQQNPQTLTAAIDTFNGYAGIA